VDSDGQMTSTQSEVFKRRFGATSILQADGRKDIDLLDLRWPASAALVGVERVVERITG
jgi:hypothetical protein